MIPVSRFVTVTTPSFDPDAGLRLRLLDDGGISSLSRRATITPTLDGGVVVDNLGVFNSDRQFVLQVQVDEVEKLRIQNLHTNNPLLYLATAEGFFSAVSLTPVFADSQVTWTLQIIERLDS